MDAAAGAGGEEPAQLSRGQRLQRLFSLGDHSLEGSIRRLNHLNARGPAAVLADNPLLTRADLEYYKAEPVQRGIADAMGRIETAIAAGDDRALHDATRTVVLQETRLAIVERLLAHLDSLGR
ncbi:MAG: hypothetical protein ACRDI2_02415 [Chloroflexota bacterium]